MERREMEGVNQDTRKLQRGVEAFRLVAIGWSIFGLSEFWMYAMDNDRKYLDWEFVCSLCVGLGMCLGIWGFVYSVRASRSWHTILAFVGGLAMLVFLLTCIYQILFIRVVT